MSDEGTIELRAGALAALQTAAPDAKCAAVAGLVADARSAAMPVDVVVEFVEPAGLPGRPVRPQLLAPADVPRRNPSTPAGRIALLHALAHIEFNAIDLALDIIWRFAGMPERFYRDWLGVAAEEAEHFELLASRLAAHGAAYGDCVAHDGLWEMARRTRHDVVERLALVPRVLEARGLDASPGLIAKLRRAGDEASARVVERILHDEVGHVALGNRWYAWICEQRDLDPAATFSRLVDLHRAPRVRHPFNLDARRRAGFTESELFAMSQSSEWP